jgi:hypothetical protein
MEEMEEGEQNRRIKLSEILCVLVFRMLEGL